MSEHIKCAVVSCQNPAIHIVHMKVEYWEKLGSNEVFHSGGSRWRRSHDPVNIFVCRTHRNHWLQRGATLIKEGGLI
jgi:hypothetical protein